MHRIRIHNRCEAGRLEELACGDASAQGSGNPTLQASPAPCTRIRPASVHGNVEARQRTDKVRVARAHARLDPLGKARVSAAEQRPGGVRRHPTKVVLKQSAHDQRRVLHQAEPRRVGVVVRHDLEAAQPRQDVVDELGSHLRRCEWIVNAIDDDHQKPGTDLQAGVARRRRGGAGIE